MFHKYQYSTSAASLYCAACKDYLYTICRLFAEYVQTMQTVSQQVVSPSRWRHTFKYQHVSNITQSCVEHYHTLLFNLSHSKIFFYGCRLVYRCIITNIAISHFLICYPKSFSMHGATKRQTKIFLNCVTFSPTLFKIFH